MQGLYNTYYDIEKATLWADKPEGAEYNPRMSLSFAKGNPRLTVFPGNKGTTIQFPTDPTTMLTVCEVIKEMISMPNGTSIPITSEAPESYNNGVPSEKLKVKSTLYVGKSKSGILYLLLKEAGKPEIAFGLLKSKFHNYRDDTGENIPNERLSAWYAKSFATLLSNTVTYMVHQYQRDLYEYGDKEPNVIEPYDPSKSKTPAVGKSYGSKDVPKPSAAPDVYDDEIPF